MRTLTKILKGLFCFSLFLIAGQFFLANNANASATIAGKITDKDGNPLQGISVYAYQNSEIFSDSSNSAGDYEIDIDDPDPITPGKYYVAVQGLNDEGDSDLTDHFIYYNSQSATIENLQDGDVITSATLPSLNFSLKKHGMISGKVTNTDNNPIFSASLYFWNQDNNSLNLTEYSNMGGNYYATPPYTINELIFLFEFTGFNFSENTQGNYQGYVTADGYLPKYIPSSDLQVRDDETVVKDITLTKKSHVKGTIKNKNHAKLANIVVKAYKFGQTQPFASTITDSTGHYNIEIGKTGTADDFGDYSVSNKMYVIKAGEDQDSNYGYGSKKVSFSKDEVTKTGVSFTLSQKNKSFRGQVKNSSGKILKGAKVQLTLLSNANLTFIDYTNQQGKYRINNLVSGHYQISVSRGNYSSIGISDLKIKKNIHKDFKMKSAGVISGFVFSKETNAPIPGITVRLVRSGLTGITDINGHYEIPCVPVGSHKIFVNDSAYVQKISSNFNVKKNKSTNNVNLSLTLYSSTLK